MEADLLTVDFRNMYVRWGSNTPARSGIHASAILVSDDQWCVREQTLHNLYPEQGEPREWHQWDWRTSAIFETGWRLHQRWQDVFAKYGNVVYSPVTLEQMETIPTSWLKRIDGLVHAPELDLTHYDEERNLYFSPDAIIKFGGTAYVVEIKGVKQESYLELTDNLEQACSVCETVHKAREQVNLYMHLMELSRGIILVENKNTCHFRLWVVAYDRERAQKYVDRIYAVKGKTAVVKSHGMNALPARICQSVSDRRAQTCPMRSVCFTQQESKAK